MNNSHIITLYKLHNKLSCELRLSRSPCRASRARHVHAVYRAVLFDKLNTAEMHGLDTSNVSSRVVSRRDEPSGILAIGRHGYIIHAVCIATVRLTRACLTSHLETVTVTPSPLNFRKVGGQKQLSLCRIINKSYYVVLKPCSEIRC